MFSGVNPATAGPSPPSGSRNIGKSAEDLPLDSFNSFELFDKLRYLICGDAPDDGIFYVVIAVRENIAEADDSRRTGVGGGRRSRTVNLAERGCVDAALFLAFSENAGRWIRMSLYTFIPRRKRK